MHYAYTQEQLNNITISLNKLEFRGRQNCLLLESIFKVLEEGLTINITESQKDGEELNGSD
jgi:hypothetical protein